MCKYQKYSNSKAPNKVRCSNFYCFQQNIAKPRNVSKLLQELSCIFEQYGDKLLECFLQLITCTIPIFSVCLTLFVSTHPMRVCWKPLLLLELFFLLLSCLKGNIKCHIQSTALMLFLSGF